MRIRIVIISAALAFASLTACGSEDDTTPSPVNAPSAQNSAPTDNDLSFNPCALINAADVSNAAGGVFTLVKDDNPPVMGPFSERACAYTSPDGRDAIVRTLLDDAPGGTVWKNSVIGGKNSSREGAYKPLPTVGDEAFFGPAGTVTVRKAYLVVIIDMSGGTQDTKESLRMLATTAISRVG